MNEDIPVYRTTVSGCAPSNRLERFGRAYEYGEQQNASIDETNRTLHQPTVVAAFAFRACRAI